MSTVYANVTAFVGNAGRHFELSEGDAYSSDHPLVLASPELFTDVHPASVSAVPGPVRAVETVGEIEEIEPVSEDVPNEPLSTENAAPIVRRPRKPKSV